MDLTALSSGPSFRHELKVAVHTSLTRRKTRLRSTAIKVSSKFAKKQEGRRGFLDLPPEIREKIYKYVFQDTLLWDGRDWHSASRSQAIFDYPHPKIDPSWKWIRRRLLPAYLLLLLLLRFSSPIRTTTFILSFLNRMPSGGASLLLLNRQIHHEASHVLYSSFTYMFTLRAFGNLPGDSMTDTERQPRSIRLANQFATQLGNAGISLRFLELTLFMPDIVSTGDDEADAACRKRAQNHWLATCRLFKSTFPELQKVDLIIHPSMTDNSASDPAEPVDRVLEIARVFGKTAKISEPGTSHDRFGYGDGSWETKFVKDCKVKWEKEKKRMTREAENRVEIQAITPQFAVEEDLVWGSEVMLGLAADKSSK